MHENAVLVLLKKPALDFVREMRRHADADAAYLDAHKDELVPAIRDSLLKGGLFWDIQILERDSMSILEQAIIRLRQIEK